MQHDFRLGSAAEAIQYDVRYDVQYSFGEQTPGSKEHPDNCVPCAFVWKTSGCSNGTACPFCHLCDMREKKKKQKESRRELKEIRGMQEVNAEPLGW